MFCIYGYTVSTIDNLSTGNKNLIPKEVKHINCDISDVQTVTSLIKNNKFDVVIHLAAEVGGIGANMENPGRFFYANASMGINMVEGARLNNVDKFIFVSTVCGYPKYANAPFLEDEMWDGYPEETNAPYGIAKRIMHTHSLSYRKQYDFNSIMLILTNLYGPMDNFKKVSSHVVAALIKRFYEAKKNNIKEVSVWGNGNSTRDFCYIEDIVSGIISAAENYNDSKPINLASGKETTIREIAEIIKKQQKF